MTFICPPCRRAADLEADAVRHDPDHVPTGHAPQVCRDRDIQPGGCPCQHKSIRPAAEDEVESR